MDFTYLGQALIGILIITDPISRGLYFRVLTAGEPASVRAKYALKVSIAVAVILFGSAAVGRELLEFIGINLGAFSFAGGLIVAGMGFEMLAGGQHSRAQGGAESEAAPADNDGMIVPFATPFIAGPGAITTVITFATQTGQKDAWTTTLVAVAIVCVLLFVSLTVFSQYLKLSDAAISLFVRLGGLIIATIGVQLCFNGIKTFFQL